MIKKTMKVRENTFRKLEDPFENGAAKKYVFYVKVDDVAEGIPMATNPRDQKLTSGVATAIKESLLSNDGYFHLKNRGIVLSAESVHYNNKEKIATIIFSDELSHGNIDGGHTYKIVCEHKGENLEQYVQFEVMTGVEDIIENLAEARNTSVQVDAKSMAELAEKFDPIKEGLEGMPFFKRIAFKQNQISVDDETGKKNKMIDAREIVAIISMFNISLYDALHHPTQAYSSKAKMLDMYLKNPEEYREYVNIMPDIFDLYDAVEMEFADAYNAGGGRYGRKKYAGYKDGKIVAKSKFGLNKMQYKVPDMKDNRGNKMKDYILRQRLAEYDAKLDLVYRNFSEYVHLAEKAFYSSVTTSSSEQYDIEFSVGLPLKEKANPVLLEVANAFVYYVKLQNNLVNQIVISKAGW